MATLPVIFDEDIVALQIRLQTALETALGRTLAPADVETLITNTFCYELQLIRIQGNNAFRQSLVDFASAPMLDYLAALVGVVRLAAASASCTLQFDLVPGHNAVTVPSGTRVQSVDGAVVFQTVADISAAIGTDTVTIEGIAATSGAIGNGYTANNVNVLLDPQAFISSVENIDTTAGGNDAETDDQLRARIKLAPASFSVAGPTEAYIFWAKSADPSIVDVACVTTNPGEVTLYPLCAGGLLPSSQILADVLAICSDTKIRPQNDTVLSAAPTVSNYSIEVNLTTYTSAIDADVITAVTAALQSYVNINLNSLGKDVILTEIIALSKLEGQVYDVAVVNPTGNVIAGADNVYTNCTGITVNIIGHHA